MLFCVFVTFPYGILGQVWYLNVNISDLNYLHSSLLSRPIIAYCRSNVLQNLPYFRHALSNHMTLMHSFYPIRQVSLYLNAIIFLELISDPMMITYSFNNFTEGIKSPTVFDIPPQCKHAAYGNMVGHFFYIP